MNLLARASFMILAASASALVVGGLGLACSSAPVVVQPPKSCTLQVVGMTVIASPHINLEEDGSPRPVQLRIYQLKTDTRMLGATFEQVWQDDKAILKDDLVKVDELSVFPDTRSEIKFERNPDALFVVGVALFRKPQGRTWWTEFELPPAPGKGDCMTSADSKDSKCSGPDCNKDGGADGGASGPPLKPHFSLWLDESRIDDGSDHLDEFPDASRIRQLFLKADAPAAGANTSTTPAAAPAQTGAKP